MSITIDQYFGGKRHPIEHEANANNMLSKVNLLLDIAKQDGFYGDWICPNTNSQISGSKGGSGDGGYRLPDSKTGSSKSRHRTAEAVDIYDPDRILAQWCVRNKAELVSLGLYCEDFRWTPTWCHFQNVKPASRKVIYIPSVTPPLAPALEGQKPIPFLIK